MSFFYFFFGLLRFAYLKIARGALYFFSLLYLGNGVTGGRQKQFVDYCARLCRLVLPSSRSEAVMVNR